MDLYQLKKDIVKAYLNVDMSTKELCFSLQVLLSPCSSKNCFFSINSGSGGFYACSEMCEKGCAIMETQD